MFSIFLYIARLSYLHSIILFFSMFQFLYPPLFIHFSSLWSLEYWYVSMYWNGVDKYLITYSGSDMSHWFFPLYLARMNFFYYLKHFTFRMICRRLEIFILFLFFIPSENWKWFFNKTTSHVVACFKLFDVFIGIQGSCWRVNEFRVTCWDVMGFDYLSSFMRRVMWSCRNWEQVLWWKDAMKNYEKNLPTDLKILNKFLSFFLIHVIFKSVQIFVIFAEFF